MSDSVYRCPRCGGPLTYESTCPGFERDGRVWVCVGCGNAEEWTCSGPGCGWWYREPRGVRRDTATMGEAPAWVAELLMVERSEP